MVLTCAVCGASNAENANFCSKCGAPTPRYCPACGAPVAVDDRFCSTCGHALATRSDEELASDHHHHRTEERRVISALFCDLVGFTADSDRADPEDVKTRLTEYHQLVKADVERFGGRVEKLIGDGVFAVFGTPTAHEDDPERAVRAALRVQDSIAALDADRPELPMSVRIAVTTGEALVQLDQRVDREGIVGDVVNTASRLEGMAAPGTVVVDEATFRATRGTVDYDVLDPVLVKGKAEPIQTWRATCVRSRYGIAVEADDSTPFVGRTSDLALLIDAFDRSIAHVSLQLVTVTGEPGVGKSRLVQELRSAIDDRPDLVWWRQSRCLPYGERSAFWPIGQLIKAHAGILDSESQQRAVAKLDEAIGSLADSSDEAAWMSVRLRALIGARAGTAERGELFAAWARFFELLAFQNPLVLVVEDLHWADDAVIEFLDYLSENVLNAPILLLVTARPELFTHRPDWGAGKRDATTITLGPLSEAESAQLMGSITSRAVMPANLQRELIERAGGNPLYVTEYVRLADEQEWLTRLEAGDSLPLPPTVQAIIGARIDLLSADEKNVLQTAAVVGRVFWTAALSFASGLSQQQVADLLQRLARRGMVRSIRRTSMEGQDEHTFAHVLVRDVAYARLTKEERAHLHEAVGQWLEAVSGERTADVAGLLAHHLVTAHELAPTDDAHRRRRIYRFLMLAAERAACVDVGQGKIHAERAVEFADTDRDRGRALLEQGRLTFDTTSGPAAALDAAIEILGLAGESELQALALSQRSQVEWYQGDSERADHYDRLALELIEGLPSSRAVAEVMIASANRLHLRGLASEALERLDPGLTIARDVGDTALYANALVTRGSTLTQLGDLDARSDMEHALQIQLDLNETRSAMRTYNNLATAHITTGEPGRGLEVIDEAIAYGSGRGLHTSVDWSEGTRAEALFVLGDWDEINAVLERYAGVDRVQGAQIGTNLLSFQELVKFYRGAVRNAYRRWTPILTAGLRAKDPQAVTPGLAFATMMAFEADDIDTAQLHAREFRDFAISHPLFLWVFILYVARPMLQLGMRRDVENLVGEPHPPTAWFEAVHDGVQALLCADAGDHRDAVHLWQPLIGLTDARSIRLWATYARIEAARSAIELGDRQQADNLLDEASTLAGSMSATLFLDHINALRDTRGRASAS